MINYVINKLYENAKIMASRISHAELVTFLDAGDIFLEVQEDISRAIGRIPKAGARRQIQHVEADKIMSSYVIKRGL